MEGEEPRAFPNAVCHGKLLRRQRLHFHRCGSQRGITLRRCDGQGADGVDPVAFKLLCQRSLRGADHQLLFIAGHLPLAFVIQLILYTRLILCIHGRRRVVTGFRLIAEGVYHTDPRQHKMLDQVITIHRFVVVPDGQHRHIAIVFNGRNGHQPVLHIHGCQTVTVAACGLGIVLQIDLPLGIGIPKTAVAVAASRIVISKAGGPAGRDAVHNAAGVVQTCLDPVLLIALVYLHGQNANAVNDLIIVVIILTTLQRGRNRNGKVHAQLRRGKSAVPQHDRHPITGLQRIGRDVGVTLGHTEFHHLCIVVHPAGEHPQLVIHTDAEVVQHSPRTLHLLHHGVVGIHRLCGYLRLIKKIVDDLHAIDMDIAVRIVLVLIGYVLLQEVLRLAEHRPITGKVIHARDVACGGAISVIGAVGAARAAAGATTVELPVKKLDHAPETVALHAGVSRHMYRQFIQQHHCTGG